MQSTDFSIDLLRIAQQNSYMEIGSVHGYSIVAMAFCGNCDMKIYVVWGGGKTTRIWNLGIKDKFGCHSGTKVGRSNTFHKYSEKLIFVIERLLKHPPCFAEFKDEYSKNFLQGKTRRKIKT